MTNSDTQSQGKNRLLPHPAAERFPMMSAEEFDALKVDIKERGLLEPIWITADRLILDGRNRYAACLELGIDPVLREYAGATPYQFAWSMNGIRRQLSKSQLATIAVSFLPELKEEAKKRQTANLKVGSESPVPPIVAERGNEKRGEAVAQAADIVGASRSLVQQAKALSEKSPELFKEVSEGKLSVRAATEVMKGVASRPVAPPVLKEPREKRIADITSLSAEGFDAAQIADKIGTSADRVRQIAHEEGLSLHGNRARQIDARRIVGETVMGIENYVKGLNLLPPSLEFDAAEAREWFDSLTESHKSISRLRKQLQECFT